MKPIGILYILCAALQCCAYRAQSRTRMASTHLSAGIDAMLQMPQCGTECVRFIHSGGDEGTGSGITGMSHRFHRMDYAAYPDLTENSASFMHSTRSPGFPEDRKHRHTEAKSALKHVSSPEDSGLSTNEGLIQSPVTEDSVIMKAEKDFENDNSAFTSKNTEPKASLKAEATETTSTFRGSHTSVGRKSEHTSMLHESGFSRDIPKSSVPSGATLSGATTIFPEVDSIMSNLQESNFSQTKDASVTADSNAAIIFDSAETNSETGKAGINAYDYYPYYEDSEATTEYVYSTMLYEEDEEVGEFLTTAPMNEAADLGVTTDSTFEVVESDKLTSPSEHKPKHTISMPVDWSSQSDKTLTEQVMTPMETLKPMSDKTFEKRLSTVNSGRLTLDPREEISTEIIGPSPDATSLFPVITDFHVGDDGKQIEVPTSNQTSNCSSEVEDCSPLERVDCETALPVATRVRENIELATGSQLKYLYLRKDDVRILSVLRDFSKAPVVTYHIELSLFPWFCLKLELIEGDPEKSSQYYIGDSSKLVKCPKVQSDCPLVR